MTNFKAGDKVRLIIRKEYKRTIIKVNKNGTVNVRTPNGNIHFDQRAEIYELDISSEKEAIKFLTEAGYIVTPPAEKVKGTAYVYKSPWEMGTTITSDLPPELFNNKRCRQEEPWPLLAKINWVEGDGL